MPDIFKVARWEYRKMIRNKVFLVITFLLPVLILVAGFVVNYLDIFDGEPSPPSAVEIGIVDNTDSIFYVLGEELADTGYRLEKVEVTHSGEEKYKQVIEENEYDGLLVIPEDVYEENRSYFYTLDFDEGICEVRENLSNVVSSQRLEEHGYPPVEIYALISEVGVEYRDLDAVSVDDEKEGVTAAMSMVLAFLMVFVSVFSGSYLLHSINKEKSDKVVELLFSSITAGSLMYGKITGFALLGLTQIFVWVLAGIFTAYRFLDLSPVLLLNRNTLLLAIYFVLGYFMVSCMNAMAGAATKSNTAGSDASISSYIAIIPFVPLWFTGTILENPEGTIGTLMTYLPFFSPPTMLLRLGMGEVDFSTILITLVIIIVFNLILMKLAAKIFKVGMLMYGQKMSLKKLWRVIW